MGVFYEHHCCNKIMKKLIEKSSHEFVKNLRSGPISQESYFTTVIRDRMTDTEGSRQISQPTTDRTDDGWVTDGASDQLSPTSSVLSMGIGKIGL